MVVSHSFKLHFPNFLLMCLFAIHVFFLVRCLIFHQFVLLIVLILLCLENLFYNCNRRGFFVRNMIFKKYLFIFRERERERARETSMCGCLSCTPNLGPGLQPRHVPLLGIKPVTLWFAGQCSTHWATPARAECDF